MVSRGYTCKWRNENSSWMVKSGTEIGKQYNYNFLYTMKIIASSCLFTIQELKQAQLVVSSLLAVTENEEDRQALLLTLEIIALEITILK